MLKYILKMFGFGLNKPVAPYRTVRRKFEASIAIYRPVGGSIREISRRKRQIERGIIRETHPTLTDHAVRAGR